MRRACILAAVAAIGSMTFVSAAQADLRVTKNFRMNSDSNAFRGKDQIGMAVNPNDPQHIVAVNCEYLTEEAEATRSTDGGQTWSEAVDLKPPGVPGPEGTPQYFDGCRVGSHLANQIYQTVAWGSGNNVYAVFRTPRSTVTGDEEGATVFLAKSSNGGQSWGTPVVAMQGGTTPGGGPEYELPTIAVDPAAQGGVDRVYVAAIERSVFGSPAGSCTNPSGATNCTGDIGVVRSIDAGQTFQGAACPAGTNGPCPTRVEPADENVSNPDGPSEPVVLDDGSVVIAWRSFGTAAAVRVARSTDQGVSWTGHTTVANVVNNAANSGTNPPAPSPNTGSSFPRLAVDQAGAGVGDDRIYIVYNQESRIPPTGTFTGQDHFISPDSDVYFQRSLNGGTAWSQPKLINEAAPKPGHESPANPPQYGVVTQTRHPNIAVAPNGRVDIVWQDRRHWYRGCIHTHQPCVEARLGDTYYAFSGNGGTSFSPNNKRISDRSHNNDVGYDYRFGTGWAFGPEPVPIGNDQLLVGWMDSREGSFDTDTQDIYLARVNHAGAANANQQTINRPNSAVDLSVALSQHTYPGGGESLLASEFATRNGTRVVIVNENDTPAILAASVLARANLSQVLLSPSGGLPQNVRDEIVRMNPYGAYVIGSTSDLSAQVLTDVQNALPPDDPADPNDRVVERIGTANDAETARDIALELDRRTDAQKTANVPAFNAAVIANPNSPEASAVAGLASARRLPILFTDPNNPNTLPAATQTALGDATDVNQTLVVGGTGVVSPAIFTGLQGSGDTPERLDGANQYEVSEDVIDESLERGLPSNVVYAANGASPIDGALLGSTVGRVTGLLMLSQSPVSQNAQSDVQGGTLAGDVDQLIVVQAAQAPGGIPQYPIPGRPGATVPFAGCPSATTNVVLGTAGNDVRNGTLAGDRIFVGTGNDRVDGLAGNDCIDLGAGNDRGTGSGGNDLILGGPGADRVSGSSGNDTLRGNAGNDRVNGGFGNDRIHGQSGRDRVSGSRGRDRINGGSGRDTISGGSTSDRIAGDAGSDRINGNSGNDRISGNSGSDRIRGSSGRDRIRAGSGNDRIAVRDGQVDRVNCGSGRDRVSADASDIVSGNCENVSVAGASAAAAAGSLGLPAVVGGAYVALLGWHRRRSRTVI